MQTPASVTLFFCSSNAAASTCTKGSLPLLAQNLTQNHHRGRTQGPALRGSMLGLRERNFPMWKQQQSHFFLWCEMLINPEKPCSAQAPGQPVLAVKPGSPPTPCQPHGLHGVPAPAVGPGSSGSSSTYIRQVAAPAVEAADAVQRGRLGLRQHGRPAQPHAGPRGRQRSPCTLR